MASPWTPTSWQGFPNEYGDLCEENAATKPYLDKIRSLPPLVSAAEADTLRLKIRDAALGKMFLWQGGDCAELFDYCQDTRIASQRNLIVRCATTFHQLTNLETLPVLRIAGHYGKPRTGRVEELDGGILVQKFHGDLINGHRLRDRELDPSRLLQAYFHSSCTLNYLRTMAPTGTPVFTSHEALYLHFEAAATKRSSHVEPTKNRSNLVEASTPGDLWYNTSAHFVWIGDKTRQLDGAHVEYFRGIQNPIGIKLGPTTESAELVKVLEAVDPQKSPGRVTLITRIGASKVRQRLPTLIRAVQSTNRLVLWQCDPMHGNSRMTSGGVRTRDLSNMLKELEGTMEVHTECGSRLGGIHLEMTGDDVVECVGDVSGRTDEVLGPLYETKCDPRLNGEQALLLANRSAEMFNSYWPQN